MLNTRNWLLATLASLSLLPWSVSQAMVTEGVASYYADHFHGRRTASGQPFNMHALTAAHRTLKFGTRVRVTNKANGRSVDVVINDRGPYIRGRTIDLSKSAAQQLGMLGRGVARVRLQVLNGSSVSPSETKAATVPSVRVAAAQQLLMELF